MDNFAEYGDQDAFEQRRILMEIAARQCETLKLYRPMPGQQLFHASMAKERIIRAGNRGGKTMAAAAEVARAVTMQDPWNRYPEGQTWYCVGKDMKVVGEVMHKYLFRPGAFKIIRDEITGQWRPYNESLPGDRSRKRQRRPAPPLIPQRFIEDISWESKKDKVPRIVYLNNGNALHFFSANGLPPVGTSITGAWMTEEIPQHYWYPELAARLVDQNGWFIWDATPQLGSEQFYKLHERAMEQIEKDVQPRTCEEFELSSVGNEYLDKEAFDAFKDKLEDEDYEVRVSGEFANLSFRVYPEYRPEHHDVAFREIPPNWTRYAAIDPGRQVCAVLFMAISPPDEGEEAWLYDELYIRGCNAEMFGEQMAEKCHLQQFRAFLIDWQEGQKSDTGSGLNIGEQYAQALRKRHVRCELTGSEFTIADNNPRSGVSAVRNWLIPGHTGKPKLRIMRERMKNFLWEIKRYHYRRNGGMVTDEPLKKNDHCMDCLRYLVQFRPSWLVPKQMSSQGSAAYKAFLKKTKGFDKKEGIQLVLGPGGM